MDESALLWDEIAVSAGARGLQLLIDPEKLISYRSIRTADIIV